MKSGTRRLLFRLGNFGFCLYMDDLVEICTQTDGLIDRTQVDCLLSVVGAFSFRRTKIPVIDLSARLGITATRANVLLVFDSSEGNWALQADAVECFCFAEEMHDMSLPHLLKAEGWSCFNVVSLYRSKPYLLVNLAACYGQV